MLLGDANSWRVMLALQQVERGFRRVSGDAGAARYLTVSRPAPLNADMGLTETPDAVELDSAQ